MPKGILQVQHSNLAGNSPRDPPSEPDEGSLHLVTTPMCGAWGSGHAGLSRGLLARRREEPDPEDAIVSPAKNRTRHRSPTESSSQVCCHPAHLLPSASGR